jgi:hypothetical protein
MATFPHGSIYGTNLTSHVVDAPAFASGLSLVPIPLLERLPVQVAVHEPQQLASLTSAKLTF